MLLTIEKVKELGACRDGLNWFEQSGCTTVEETVDKLLKTTIEERYAWSNWLLSKVLTNEGKIKYEIFAAELVLTLYEKKYPNDNRPRKAIEATKKYLENPTDVAACVAVVAAAFRAFRAARAAYAAAGEYEKTMEQMTEYGLSLINPN